MEEEFTGTTPQLILREAARLFSHQGFHGTSTREIADAVGIRQPSLFHHFASKVEIAKALFEYDYHRSPGMQGVHELADSPPAVRLYQVIRREVEVETTSMYDLRGLYLSPILDEAEFAKWRSAYERAMRLLQDLIKEGIASGDFVDQDPRLVVEVMDAVLNQTLRWGPEKRDAATADDVAELLMRLVLARPARIAAVRREADRAMAQVNSNA